MLDTGFFSVSGVSGDFQKRAFKTERGASFRIWRRTNMKDRGASTVMLASANSYTVEATIDLGDAWKGGRHIFSDLPIRIHTQGAADHETERLISHDADTKPIAWEERVPKVMWALSTIVCLVGLVGALTGAIFLAMRLNSSIEAIDGAVSLHASAASMIKNVDRILNSSAHIASTVNKLSLKGVEATQFSTPYLAKILNTSTDLLNDVHKVVEHPSIQIGG